MRKIGVLLFLLAAGSCVAQFFPGSCCGFGITPAQRDELELTARSVPAGPADRPSGETVSAARLRHVPPRQARKAFARGMKSAAARDYRSAAAAFAEAIAVDPAFSEAHGNLAVEYTWIGRFNLAVSEFQRALQLDPTTALHRANLAYALIRLDRDAEAEAEAQTAVSLDPTYAVAQFLLGCLLARRPETRSLSENHLLYAARSIPEAHLALAQLYDAQGASQVAGTEMKRYRQAAALNHHGSAVRNFLPRP